MSSEIPLGLKKFKPKPPFIMQNGRVKDVGVLVTSMPVGVQNLVAPEKTILGFDNRLYIPMSYANTLGYYPDSGSGNASGSGSIDSGDSGASGSNSGDTPPISGENTEPEIGPVFKPKSGTKNRFRK